MVMKFQEIVSDKYIITGLIKHIGTATYDCTDQTYTTFRGPERSGSLMIL